MATESQSGNVTVNDDLQISSIRRVVVDLDPHDDDDRRFRAFAWARDFATKLGVPLVAWVSVSRDSAERSTTDERRFEVQAADITRGWLRERGGEVDEIDVAPVNDDTELLASTMHGDIVVLGVDATEGLTGWALGSRAHELAHSLDCPLVIVPPEAPASKDAPVVVGVDGSDANEAVVDWAKHLAKDLRRDLVPVFAYNAVYETFDNAGNYGTDERAARAEADAESVPLTEIPGRPAQVISDTATDTNAYLTIVGVRHDHALGGLLLGRVADHLLHHPPSPIAIITYATAE